MHLQIIIIFCVFEILIYANFYLKATARASLQHELSSLSSNQSASSTEVNALRHKVEDVEREKRDLLVVIDHLKEDSAQRDGQCTVVS